MTTRINRTARFAGALYLALAPFSIFGIIYVPSVLIVPGDAAATAGNIMASEGLFRSGIVSHLIGQTIFVFLVLALYQLLKPVNQRHAVLMVVLALLGVPIAFLNELNHFAVLLLLSGPEYLAAFTTDQLHAQAMLFLDLRSFGISVAQIFWGLWLFPLGYLVYRSGFLPRVLGVLVMIGGVGYLFDVVAFLRFPDSTVSISQFTFVGEVVLPLWLLFKGVDVAQWEKRVGSEE
jgi:hypothetical protein